jgi:hypothetical protein
VPNTCRWLLTRNAVTLGSSGNDHMQTDLRDGVCVKVFVLRTVHSSGDSVV